MILLMGIAGSGKGTQGKLLAEKRGLSVISTGELLRSYGSDDQHARMLSGVILGDEEVTELLDSALTDLSSQDDVILDGYPRTIKQADWLLDQARAGKFELEGVLLLNASPEAVKGRLKSRGRADDYDAAIEARFKEYEKSTLPIVKHLSDAGVPVFEIDGEHPIEEVHQEIVNRLKPTED